jgi:hypothetical protein
MILETTSYQYLGMTKIADIKGISGFKYRKTLSSILILVSSNFTETQQSATDFDANGNLLGLNNIGNLEWHYNNTFCRWLLSW